MFRWILVSYRRCRERFESAVDRWLWLILRLQFPRWNGLISTVWWTGWQSLHACFRSACTHAHLLHARRQRLNIWLREKTPGSVTSLLEITQCWEILKWETIEPSFHVAPTTLAKFLADRKIAQLSLHTYCFKFRYFSILVVPSPADYGIWEASWAPAAESGVQPWPETQFGVFWRPQNAPFCTYICWSIWGARPRFRDNCPSPAPT